MWSEQLQSVICQTLTFDKICNNLKVQTHDLGKKIMHIDWTMIDSLWIGYKLDSLIYYFLIKIDWNFSGEYYPDRIRPVNSLGSWIEGIVCIFLIHVDREKKRALKKLTLTGIINLSGSHFLKEWLLLLKIPF